jgi:hypothetical protein
MVLSAEAPAREVADEDIDRTIDEIKRYLWAAQGLDGRWKRVGGQVPDGGETAIALFALLEAGESPQDARMQKGLEFLSQLRTENLYIRATRAMVFSQVVAAAPASPYRQALEKDVAWLTRGAARAGAWGYGGPEATGDNSCSQFALMALWEADRAKIEIPQLLVRGVERTWLRRQKQDGGWQYPGAPNVTAPTTASMTAAGLASLFICQDVLTTACRPYPHQNAVEQGTAFLASRLTPHFHKDGYLAFCVQRVGLASGEKFIGDLDWFAAGAAKLCEPHPAGRQFRGRYGRVVRAAFELIFLSRGRIPLTYDKLQYGQTDAWNFHPRDLARFTDYMRRSFELRMRWQVVKITDDVQRMLDAPILFVTGSRALNLTAPDWAKLREYTLRGGTLLMLPVHGSKAFVESAKEGLRDLYVEQQRLIGGRHYALGKLAGDHPIYSLYKTVRNGHIAAPAWGVSDGTRHVAILCERDIACAWQRRAWKTQATDFDLGANFFMYATGGNPMRRRMRPVFSGSDRQPRHHLSVAWLRHGGNWHSQPFALEYLSQKLTAENRVALEVSVGAPITVEALKGHPLAWMTGSDSFALTKEQVAALRAYLQAGGMLFVNAVGGSKDFRASAETMLKELFTGLDHLRGEVSFSSPLITGRCGEFRGPRIENPHRTRSWRRRMPKTTGVALTLYALAGRVAAIHAPYGIHDTLDGHTAHDAKSYMPAPARDLAANIALYALAQSVETRRPEAATRPGGPAATK